MLKAAKVYQSGMVLQRGKPLVFRGTCRPGEWVEVTLGTASARAEADAEGNWRVALPPHEADTGLTVVLATEEERVELTDVAVGEVWIAAGQSNMEFWLRYEKHRAEEQEELPLLRFYDVPKLSYPGQERDFDYSRVGCWRRAEGKERDYFSAVGYYFQKEIAGELDVPVGILGCNWGGTPCCAWMNRATVERVGPRWIEAERESFRGIDPEDYRRKMACRPDNATGDPFHNPFNEFMLPGTPSPEKVRSFCAAHAVVSELASLPLPQNVPGALWERMVKTIAPFPVRGVLWYQGESDDIGDRTGLYARMLAGLVADWRGLWGEQLPFLVVQLPGWESWMEYRNTGFWDVRACQQAACEADPDLYLCSIADVGEREDIHPKDKRTVGERLALLALGHVYGRDILCDPPSLEGAVRRGNLIRLTFRNAGSGLSIQGNALEALTATAPDGPLVPAVRVDGTALELTLPREAGSVRVDFARTAWYRVNLYNSAGLPALPFSVTL